MGKDDNVTTADFNPKVRIRKGLKPGRRARTCRHRVYLLDEPGRRVYCDTCGVELDVIKVLSMIASDQLSDIMRDRARDELGDKVHEFLSHGGSIVAQGNRVYAKGDIGGKRAARSSRGGSFEERVVASCNAWLEALKWQRRKRE